ncbi:carboxylate-amine ligase [Lentzea xinjiangensis]|uniref:Putative glutamate--cysteine ligase 2 n=1 Tax=Lentzea xinjiangensis TaxID=402600 RepID=A0A1H9NK98_9PSEU|nr:YbdK family carboxylate-amine ligase [Lentzea xinjiangensis]SER36366.1 carboxylate-amine ligase [Lentzea xinjiangensis]
MNAGDTASKASAALSEGAGVTMGVEEEFLLVSRGSHLPVGDAAAVVAGVGPADLAGESRAVCELWDTEVEASTGICSDLAQVRDQLTRNRAALRRSARARGVELVPAGHPLLGAETAPPRRDGHYGWMSDTYAGALADQEICGCHVHVGLGDRELGVAVLNHLAPWLPTLLALTANSPFRRGRDTGFHSWRMMVLTRLPSSGIPPWFGSAAEYDADLVRLRECGLLPPGHGGLRLARLSDHLPTVEVRVADTTATIDEVVLYAALVRGLVRAALDELDAGREARRCGDTVLGDALWAAARHGLDGPAVDPWSGMRTSPHTMASRLYRHTEDALTATGDLGEVRTLLQALLTSGNGAMRQRIAAARHGVPGALDVLVRGAEEGGTPPSAGSVTPLRRRVT